MKTYIIIVAGGKGNRMNNVVPKQFILLQGKPILMHTIEKFHTAVPGISSIVVIASELMQEWKNLCISHHFNTAHQLVAGGETRFHSVKNGLQLLPDDCIAGIHDAARPLVSEHTIITAFETAALKGNAAPAVSVTESMREIKGEMNTAVDRNHYVIVQTPQCFHSTVIKKAFEQDYTPLFTDDVSVAEAAGHHIHLIEGNRENIKITTPQDLIIAEAFMKSNAGNKTDK